MTTFPIPTFLTDFYRKHALLVQVGVIAAIVLAMVANGKYPSTKLGFLIILVLGVINPRVRDFAVDFSPFIMLLLTYGALRSFADNLSPSDIHITDMIAWERSLYGGHLPGYVMQSNLWNQPFTPVLDVLANGLYLSHFMTPVLAAGLIWRKNVVDYWAYAIGLVVLSFAGFVTYILFPAAPPWWATAHGYLWREPITLQHFVISGSAIANSANPVAAMPSLHAAYPTYIAITCIMVWGRRAVPVILLPVGVILATIYLGHHYTIDAFVGMAYAGFASYAVFGWARRQGVAFDWFGLRRAPQQVARRI